MSETKPKSRYFSVSGAKIASVKIDGKLYPLYRASDIEKTTRETPADAVRFVRRTFEEAFPEVSEEDRDRLMSKIKKYQIRLDGSKKKVKKVAKPATSEEKPPKKKTTKKTVDNVPMKKSKKTKESEPPVKQMAGYTLFQQFIRNEVEKIQQKHAKRPNTVNLWKPTMEEKKQKWNEIRTCADEGQKITMHTLEKMVSRWAKESSAAASN